MNHLDLFQNAFTELADVSKGIINVNWEWTKCPIDSPLQAHMKSGVSPFWFSVQIVNANKVSSHRPWSLVWIAKSRQRIADVQYSTDGGKTWKGGLTRQPYNFFQLSSGTGTNTVDVRAESVDGDRVIIKNVKVEGGNLVNGPGNF
jgi:expansin (peptidoglycan-binding protein)